jgi:heavy metal sensor kinase
MTTTKHSLSDNRHLAPVFRSIKWRLQIWQMLMLAGVLVALLSLHYHLREKELVSRVDRELQNCLVTVLPIVSPPKQLHSGPDGPTHTFREFRTPERDIQSILAQNCCYVIVWEEDGSLREQYGDVPDSVQRPTQKALEPGRNVLVTRGNYRELIQNQPRKLLVLIGRPLDDVNEKMQRTLLNLLLVGFGIMGVGFVGGLLIINRTIRPIREISATAERISAGERSQRIELSDAPAELESLARILNGTFDHLDDIIENHKRFSADASHELRTPVSVVIAQCQAALKRDRTAEEYKTILQACLRAGQRMKNMAESLLTLTRIDSRSITLSKMPTDLNKVLSGAVDSASLLSEKHPIDFQCLPKPLIAEIDPDRMHQIVMNLLINAVQHNPDGCPLHVVLREANADIEIEVADEGTGIPAEHLPHVFARFYRVDKSRSRAQGGAGLGLSIVQSLVEAHGGTIHVSSRPGAGTHFTIIIPHNPNATP